MDCIEVEPRDKVTTGYICWNKPDVVTMGNPMLNVCKPIGTLALTGNVLLQACLRVFFLDLCRQTHFNSCLAIVKNWRTLTSAFWVKKVKMVILSLLMFDAIKLLVNVF